jgi:predicted site-specific integrase-resolvase|tara:strand:+ start:284 stop:508 length:225 start_codon:yes stop_codon:yes gene_type:complete
MTDTVYSDVNKTAEYFGVSIHTIRKWVKEGHIPRDHYIRGGTTYRYNIPAIEKELTSSSKPEQMELPLQEASDE